MSGVVKVVHLSGPLRWCLANQRGRHLSGRPARAFKTCFCAARINQQVAHRAAAKLDAEPRTWTSGWRARLWWRARREIWVFSLACEWTRLQRASKISQRQADKMLPQRGAPRLLLDGRVLLSFVRLLCGTEEPSLPLIIALSDTQKEAQNHFNSIRLCFRFSTSLSAAGCFFSSCVHFVLTKQPQLLVRGVNPARVCRRVNASRPRATPGSVAATVERLSVAA